MYALEQALQFGTRPVSLQALVLQLLVGITLAMIIRWHFCRFASVLSNRDEFALIFPFILLTTLLIINVVKSSLALSLGLIGALSIVRFRTPIKEPEELAYLFLAIAVGVGLGANQIPATLIVTFVILGVMARIKQVRRHREKKNLYLSLSLEGASGEESQIHELSDIVSRHARATDLRRFETTGSRSELAYFIAVNDTTELAQLTDALRSRYPGIEVTFIDQPRIPGL